MNIDTLEIVKNKAFDFGRYLADHWITVIILGVSSTQTYYLVSTFSPDWASWLPLLGVGLMEGGYLYWRWREYESDPLDLQGKGVSNKQEGIANIMVYLTLGASVLTMLAGAALEVANSDIAFILAIPDMEMYLGLFAVTCIFLLAGGHLYADWQYRRNDPDAVMERNFREESRKLTRDRRRADIDGEKIILNGRNEELRRLYGANGANMGKNKAAEEFEVLVNSRKANPPKGNGN